MQYQITDVYETRSGISAVLSCDEGDGTEKTLLFKPSLWLEEKLQAGDILDEERMEQLCSTAQYCQAIARAEGLLANSDYSRTRLIHRLMRFGFDRSVCERAADYMIEKGYIRETDQTLRIARFYCKSKHWGKKRIAAELMGRGYCHDAVMNALNSLSDEEYFASLMQLVEKKYSTPCTDDKEKQKRIAALSRLGFSFGEIQRAFEELELEKETAGIV